MQPHDPRKPVNLSRSSLAESVAHELNNIAASLFGFVELAAEQVDDGSPLLQCLGEIRIGVSRMTKLAAVLEALAEVGGSTAKGAIEAFVGRALQGTGERSRFDWECDPATLVEADPERLQRCLSTLTHLRNPDEAQRSDVVLTVSRTAGESRCSFCGAALAPGSVKLVLIADAVRLASPKTSGGRRRAGGTFSQLVVTGGVHLAHLAGGHVLLDGIQSSISVVLSAA